MGSSGIRRRLTGRDAFGSASALVRAFVAAGLAVPLATGVLGPAGSVSAATSGWHIQPTPNPPSTGGVLAADSCASPTACMAVGSYRNGSRVFPLAERWNGTSWSLLKPPVPTGAGDTSLLGVSCVSANACIAVGSYRSKSGNVLTLAEAWNGTSWSIQPVPLPAGAARAFLNSVSCTSASACIAVGSSLDSASNNSPLAERWDGTSWSIQQTPAPAGGQAVILNGVSCPSATSCTAVGSYQASGVPFTLAETWDGTSWSVQPTANPASADDRALSGVSCRSAGVCTAVGYFSKRVGNLGASKTQTLAEAEP
jgi:hypothetical protein